MLVCDQSSEVSHTHTISHNNDAVGHSNGFIHSGRSTDWNNSVITWRFLYTSDHRSNSTLIILSHIVVEERTANTPGAPLRTLSNGEVTSCSTSSGARHSTSVKIVTLGLSKSGKTSIGNERKALTHRIINQR